MHVMIDEFANMSTASMARALDLMRGKINFILPNQFMYQLMDEDKSGHLAKPVYNCCNTKLLFGGLKDEEELRPAAIATFLDQYDPYMKKESQKIPHPIPRLEWVDVYSISKARATGTQMPGETRTDGGNKVTGRHMGLGLTESEHDATVKSSITAWGDIQFMGTGIGDTTGVWDGMEPMAAAYHNETSNAGDAFSNSGADGLALIKGKGNARTLQGGLNWQDGTNWSTIRPVTPGTSEQDTVTMSVTRSPVTLHDIIEIDQNTYMSTEDQVFLWMKALRTLRKYSFWIKTPHAKATLILAPYVEEPQPYERYRQMALEKVYGKPLYTKYVEPRHNVQVKVAVNGHVNGTNGVVDFWHDTHA